MEPSPKEEKFLWVRLGIDFPKAHGAAPTAKDSTAEKTRFAFT
jgi:hypothetical protein